MALTTLSLYSPEQVDPLAEKTLVASAARLPYRRKFLSLITLLQAIISGNGKRAYTIRYGETVAASTVSISSGSGSVGATINGVTTTATWATSDINSAGLVAAAINAASDPLVKDVVKAGNYAATITVGTLSAGSELLIHGVKMRALPSATSPAEAGTFSTAGTTTNAATALVAAINNHGLLKEKVFATSSTNVVTVRGLEQTPVDLAIQQTAGTGATISGNLAPTATVLISSLWKGTIGNAQTLAASGTGVTAATTRLVGGTLGQVTTI